MNGHAADIVHTGTPGSWAPFMSASTTQQAPMWTNYSLTSLQRRLLSPAKVLLHPGCPSIDAQQCTAKVDPVPWEYVFISQMSLYLRLL